MKLRERTTRVLVNICLVLAIVLLFNLSLNYLRPVYNILTFLATPLVMALYFFYAFRPIRDFFLKLTKSDLAAALITFLIFLAIVIVLLLLTFNMIYDQTRTFISSLNPQAIMETFEGRFFNQLVEDISDFFPLEDFLTKAQNRLQEMFTGLPSTITTFVGDMGHYFSILILIVFGFFYLLKDEDKFHHNLRKMSVGSNYDELTEMGSRIHQALQAFISGQIITAGILAIFMFIGYTIIDLPYTLSLTMIAALFNFIPFLGPYLGAAPAVLVALTIEPIMILKVVIVSIVAQQLEGNFISPHITGKRLDIHPFGVIVIVMICLQLFGVIGALIASPLYITIKIVLEGLGKIIAKHQGREYRDNEWKENFIAKKEAQKEEAQEESDKDEDDETSDEEDK